MQRLPEVKSLLSSFSTPLHYTQRGEYSHRKGPVEYNGNGDKEYNNSKYHRKKSKDIVKRSCAFHDFLLLKLESHHHQIRLPTSLTVECSQDRQC